MAGRSRPVWPLHLLLVLLLLAGSSYALRTLQGTAGVMTRRLLQDDPSTCPSSSNLACISSTVVNVSSYSFNVNLPALPLPDSGDDLFGIIDPQTLLSYAKDHLPQGVQDSISTGTDLLSQLQCGSVLPAFTADTITADGFLGDLADGSCTKLALIPGNMYFVGAMSTKAVAFMKSLGTTNEAKANKAKKDGNDYAVCLAFDPCNLDFFLGFTGLTGHWTVSLGPEVPPLNIDLTFNSIAYSNSGEGTGIAESAVGLWKYNMGTGEVPAGSAILGNLDVRVHFTLTWGYEVDNKKIADLGLDGDVEMVVKFQNPTRFALQTTAQPTITMYDDPKLKIDFSALASAITTNLLFYVEHYNSSNWNVYAGIQVTTNLNALFGALPGKIGDIAKEIIDPSSEIDTYLNMNMDQDGAGIRLYFDGTVTLAQGIADVIHTFLPNVATSGHLDLGVKLAVVHVNNEYKVFGSVLIEGTEWSYGFCNSNADCLSDQYCYLGVCGAQTGCLGSSIRTYKGDVSFIGVCPSDVKGTKQWGRCYKDCKDGETTGILGGNSRFCFDNCDCGTEFGAGSLCSDKGGIFNLCGYNIRHRNNYDRTVDLVCPEGSSRDVTMCLETCPYGYAAGDGSGHRLFGSNCYVQKCPDKFPVECSDGTTMVCLKSGMDCSVKNLFNEIGALFGRCTFAEPGTALPPVTTCSPGWYIKQQGDVSCTICPAGYFCPGGASGPSTCPVNRYCPTGTGTPNTCPAAHPFAPAGSSDLTACKACDPGTYVVDGLCVPCPAGGYCPGGTDGTSHSCPSGFYCPAGSASPTLCDKYAKTTQYQYSSAGSSDASNCVPCANGTIFYASTTPPSPDNTVTCNQVPEGFYADTGALTITDCPTGFYCPAGSGSPTPCPQYNATGQFEYSPLRSANESACYPCPAGTLFVATPMPTSYPPPPSLQAQCEDNPAGTYTDVGALQRVPCPTGMYCMAGKPGVRCGPDLWSLLGSKSESDCQLPFCRRRNYLCGTNGTAATSLTHCCCCPVGYYCPGGSGLSAVLPIPCAVNYTTGESGGKYKQKQCHRCEDKSWKEDDDLEYKQPKYWFDLYGTPVQQVRCIGQDGQAPWSFVRVP